MSDSINDINNDIDAKIYVNSNGEITEPILNALLKRMATFTNDRLPVDGSVPMTGELNLNGNGIKLSEIAGKINRVRIVGDDVVFTGEDFIIISNLKGLKVDKDIEASGEIRSIDSAVVLQKTGLGKVSISTVGLTGDWEALFPNKNITVAGLDDIANALADYLKLDGTTPMTGDLDMTTNSVAVQTNKIKTVAGRLDWLAGLDSLIHDFTSWVGGGGANFTQTWRAKSGTVAHLDDIKNSYQFAASDEVTPLIADPSQAAYTDYIAVPITVNSVMINVNTAPTGANIIVDIHKNGTSIFSTLISINATENTSLTASTPYVLNGTISFAQGDKIECFINQVGSAITGAGLKVKLIQ